MAYLGWPWSPLALVKNSVSQARGRERVARGSRDLCK